MIIEWYERILWSPESDPYDVPGKILHSQQNVGFTFPMQFPPTNFLDIRIGSQLSNLDKKVRNVVPSVNGNNPILNSEINLLAYDSSSPVHLPLLKPAFLVLDIVSFILLLSDSEEDIIPSANAAS